MCEAIRPVLSPSTSLAQLQQKPFLSVAERLAIVCTCFVADLANGLRFVLQNCVEVYNVPMLYAVVDVSSRFVGLTSYLRGQIPTIAVLLMKASCITTMIFP